MTCDLYVPVLATSRSRIQPWSLYSRSWPCSSSSAAVNAVNLTDGLDGLAYRRDAPGHGVLRRVGVYVRPTNSGSSALALFPAAIAGGLAGFLCL